MILADGRGFKERYFSELDDKPQLADKLLALLKRGPVTLLFSARHTRYNQAVALKEYLMSGHKKEKATDDS